MTEAEPTAAIPTQRSIRSEAFKWFGIVGTAFTIFSNAGTFIDFSKSVKHWTDQWRELVTTIINFVAQFFQVSFDESIAVIVFSVFSCLIVTLSAQGRLTEPWSVSFRVMSALVAAALSAIYFCFVMLGPQANDPRMEPELYLYAGISFVISLVLSALVFARSTPDRDKRLWIAGIVVFVLVLVPGPVTEFGATDFIREKMNSTLTEGLFFELLSILVVTMYFVSQPISIAFRSLGILIIVACLIGLNLFATLIEQSGWFA